MRRTVGLALLNAVVAAANAASAVGQDTATWNGGSGNWSVASNWSTGVVPNNGVNTYHVAIDGNSPVVSSVTMDINSTIDTLSLDAGDSLIVSLGRTLQVNDTITNNGLITIASGVIPPVTYLTFGEATTFTGTGQLVLSGSLARVHTGVCLGCSILTNDTSHTIRGSGYLGEGNGSLDLVNKGLIEGTDAIILTIDTSTTGGGFGLINEPTGTLRGSGSAGLHLVGRIDNQGTVEALNGSNVTYDEFATITSNNVAGVLTGGTWRAVSTGGGATLTLRGSSITQIAAGTDVELSGPGSVLQVAAVPIDSTLTANHGGFSILEGRHFTSAGTFSNTGTVTIGTGSTFTAPGLTQLTGGQLTAGGWHLGQNANFTVAGANITTNFGDVLLDAGSTFSQIDSLVDNQGTFAIVNGRNFAAMAEFNNSGTLTIGAGSTFTASNGFTQQGSGTLRGSGTLTGNFINSGAIRPGNSPGILKIDGNLALTPESILYFEVGGLIPGTQHDQIQVSGFALLDGSFEVSFIDDFVPSVGDEIELITASDLVGTFSSLSSANFVFPNGSPGVPDITYRTTGVTLQFVEPSDDIQLDVPVATVVDWSDTETWTTDAVPDRFNLISIQNLAESSPLRIEIQNAPAEVHQLMVGANGVVDAGAITVAVENGMTLRTTNGIYVNGAGDGPGIIELDNGTLRSFAVEIQSGGLLSGNGQVIGDLIVGAAGGPTSATLRPGFSVGHLDVQGDYQQGANGTLLVDVNGGTAGQFDTIAVEGEVELGGTLVVDASNLVGPPGTTVELITAGSVLAGTGFDSIQTVGRPDIFFAATYLADTVILTNFPIGDMNRSGALDLADADEFALALMNSEAYFGLRGIEGSQSGNMNGTGGLDFSDIRPFADALQLAGVQNALALIERAMLRFSVPEPSAAWLMLCGLWGLVANGRRRPSLGAMNFRVGPRLGFAG